MSDSIRQQIISAIKTRAAQCTRNNAYRTDIGLNVYLAQKSQITIPALIVWPGDEAVTREHRVEVHVMDLRLDGISQFSTVDVPSEISEKMFADLIEIATGREYQIDFTSGGTDRPEIGDFITGAISGETAILQSWDKQSGDWHTGDAAGTMRIRRLSDNFDAENLNIGDYSNLVTTDGSKTTYQPETLAGGGLADDIILIAGGAEQYPDQGNEYIGARASFSIIYRTQIGNPYQSIT